MGAIRWGKLWGAAAAAALMCGCAGEGQKRQEPQEPPKAREGLWRIEHRQSGAELFAGYACVGPAGSMEGAQAPRDPLGAMGDKFACSAKGFEAPGIVWGTSTVCELRAGAGATAKIQARTEFRGDFQKGYEAKSSGSVTGADGAVASFTVESSARWVGPCPEGMRPGDVEAGDAREDARGARR